MECYIEYLDASNNFKKTTKDFKTYEDAHSWLFKNFEKPDIDFIHYY